MKIFTNINENIPKNCFTSIGFFDGVHLGHRYIIEKLKAVALNAGKEELVITLWPHPYIYFGKSIKLITTLDEKIKLFEEIGVKNLLILEFNSELADRTGSKFIKEILIEKLNISGIVMGYNNSLGKDKFSINNMQFSSDIELVSIGEFLLSNYEKVSSTRIREFLNNGDVDKASDLLGYKFELSGYVEHGYQIGRRLGFPTANLSNFDTNKIIPADGVYIIEAKVDDKWLPAMLNIGTRPTFNGDKKSVEFHIIDFDGDLYSKEIIIRFIKCIRQERKFDNSESLIEQLNNDMEVVRSYFESV